VWLRFVFLLALRILAMLRFSRRPSAWNDAESCSCATSNMLMDLEGTVGQVRFLIRDRDVLYPPGFNQVLADAGIETVRGAVRAPRMNSIMERWIGGARRGLLDRTLVWSLPHLGHILREYETHHNGHEPHLTLAGAAPDRPLPPEVADLQAFRTRRHDRVGGITHEYQQAT
jgi:hypothetical protein